MTRAIASRRAPRPALRAAVALAALALAAGRAAAAEPSLAADEAFVREVLVRLAAAVQKPDGVAIWPPVLKLVDKADPNAAAFLRDEDGRKVPVVLVHTGLLRSVVDGKPDRLALVVGHELGHHLLHHVVRDEKRSATAFLNVTFTRDQELAADRFGMEWTLKAGYSYAEALRAFKKLHELADYAPMEALAVDHPSWTERIALLDRAQPELWRAMGAFASGVFYLRAERYDLAEKCFRKVTKEFPRSHEAWANLGYALLMQYADALEPDDLKRFGIGQIVLGGFYRRAGSLEAQVRGVDQARWSDAVDALRQALRLEPGLALASANLGTAYLIRPSGPDTGKALGYLETATRSLAKDAGADPSARVAVLVNVAVAHGAAGHEAQLAAALDQAGQALGAGPEGAAALRPALEYNRAVALAGAAAPERQREAVTRFESYLVGAGPDSVWWPLAYERYAQLCQRLGRPARDVKAFGSQRGAPVYRPITSLDLPGGKSVAIGDLLTEVQTRLGPGESVPVVDGTNLRAYRYPAAGVTLVANDRILAVQAQGPDAPAVPLRKSGLGAPAELVRVGMTKADLERLLPEPPEYAPILDAERDYRIYRWLGLAVKVEKGKVTELVVLQAPRQSS